MDRFTAQGYQQTDVGVGARQETLARKPQR